MAGEDSSPRRGAPTPDGREGYQQIFLRRGWAVYAIDQPRRGRAGKTTLGGTIPDAVPSAGSGESHLWTAFRLGLWNPPDPPAFYPGVQFPQTQTAIDQYFRQITPDTGPDVKVENSETRSLLADAMATLFEDVGPAILLTHSQSGQFGWLTAMKAPDLVKAIIAYEPIVYAFPEDQAPEPIPCAHRLLEDALYAPLLVSREEFERLTTMPIQIVFGDNITTTPSPTFGVELWRVSVQRAQQFVEAIIRHGGDAEILFLPRVGVHGNTHFPFSDLNNVQVADQLSLYLHAKRLDQHPTNGCDAE